MSSSDIIKAFEEAGIPVTKTTLTKEQLAKWKEIDKEVETFLKKVEEERNKPFPNMVFK